MKGFISMLFILFQFYFEAQNVYFVSGKVMRTESYCGGAVPTREMELDYNTPKPYIGKVFYLRRGKRNDLNQKVILRFVTDSAGNFKLKLAPGVYSIVQEEQTRKLDFKKYAKNEFLQFDKTCLNAWWNKPYYLLEIKNKSVSGLSFSFHHPCFVPDDIPCMNYIGPMPP